jgi:hypothetical protein
VLDELRLGPHRIAAQQLVEPLEPGENPRRVHLRPGCHVPRRNVTVFRPERGEGHLTGAQFVADGVGLVTRR